MVTIRVGNHNCCSNSGISLQPHGQEEVSDQVFLLKVASYMKHSTSTIILKKI